MNNNPEGEDFNKQYTTFLNNVGVPKDTLIFKEEGDVEDD